MPSLVIVESPAKCAKIRSFLGPGFTVLATMGHIRALEEDLDAVGLDRDFEPRFRFLSEKSKATKPILEAAKFADTIYLAADDDREGEAIAYSVACLLKRDPLSFPRAVFHEITAKAVRNAVENPRKIDLNRVYAQQARSVLDMMVGFTISPLLWKHVARALSAGRCQTPALRLVWDREQSIKGHTSSTTWSLSGTFQTKTKEIFQFQAKLTDELEDQESAMNYLENVCNTEEATVKSIQQKPWTANPPKPLITSTLQQEASALFHINPKATMKIAQTLYEGGHITYMRTDHAIMSEEAITAAQQWVKENHGEQYVGSAASCRAAPEKSTPVKKATKGKKESQEKSDPSAAAQPQDTSSKGKKSDPSAAAQPQEAHECIRPTHFEVDELKGDWTPQDKKIYQLIWRRAVQAVMAPANGQTRTATLQIQEDLFDWQNSWKKTDFLGWQKLGATANLDSDVEDENSEADGWKQSLKLQEGTPLTWSELFAGPKSTRAQPRFTEATLIRELEQKGIGRPSTFASLVEVLFEKNYVEKKDIPGEKVNITSLTMTPNQWPPASVTKQVAAGQEKQKLVPTALGESVLSFCLKEFPHLFAYDFTAQMENRLDLVAKGEEAWKNVCRDTWASYKDRYAALKDKGSVPSSSEKVVDFGDGFKAVMSKTGPLLVREATTAGSTRHSSCSSVSGKTKVQEGANPKTDKAQFFSFPSGYTLKTITKEAAEEHMKSLEDDANLGMWNGEKIVKKKGPYGFYAECGEIRVPVQDDEPLEKIYEKLRLRAQTESEKISVGGYRFAKGQYGPYMYKEGLKTKVFLSLPPDVDPSKLTLAQAEELYKKLAEAKKAQQTSGSFVRGGFRGGRGGRGGH
jgi:DNA topoisomerase-1